MTSPTERPPARVLITSFGELHGPAPYAHHPIKVDLASALRNPHHDPKMRHLTGMDQLVRDHVMNTPGAWEYVKDTVERVTLRLKKQKAQGASELVEVHVWCRGGLHRSVSIAEEAAAGLRAVGVQTKIIHRDIDKPVVQK